MAMNRRDDDGISGGRFVNPNVLPPVRRYKIQNFADPGYLKDVAGSRLSADYTDPGYMKGDSEIPVESASSNDNGGTLYRNFRPIAGR